MSVNFETVLTRLFPSNKWAPCPSRFSIIQHDIYFYNPKLHSGK